MEPNVSDQSDQPNTNSQTDMSSTVNDLRNEGVDIVGQENTETIAETAVTSQITHPVSTPTQSPNPIVTQNDPSTKSLRTFKSDAEEAVKYKNVSATQIALAEQNKRLARQESEPRSEEYSHTSSKGMVFIVALAITILGGGAAYYYRSTIMNPNPSAALPQELRVPTIIPYAKASLLNINPQDNALTSVSQSLREATVPDSGIYAIITVPNGTTTVMATPLEIFGKTRMPYMLKRSLSHTYMIGAYSGASKSPFFILKNTYFQNAFAGMLEWERNMRNDLISIITVAHPGETATLVNSLPFEDAVISNIDTRVLKNDQGAVVLAYAFADQSTIVVTTDLDTLKKLLDKLLAVRIIQ